MLVVFKNIEYDNVLIFDAEYNHGDLIQFAGVMFRKIYKDVFQISKSYNTYVQLESDQKINPFIIAITGLTDDFLLEKGIDLESAVTAINDLLEVEGSLLVVSHGLFNDRMTLESNGIYLYGDGVHGMCTYNAAKRILKRDKDLKLYQIASEAGLYSNECHNAFDDTWSTIAVLSYLCKIEEDNKNETIL